MLSTLFPLVSAPLRAYDAFLARVFLAQTDAPSSPPSTSAPSIAPAVPTAKTSTRARTRRLSKATKPATRVGNVFRRRLPEHRKEYYLPVPMAAVAVHVSLALLFCLGSWALLIAASVASPCISSYPSSTCISPASPVFDLLTDPSSVPCACQTVVYPLRSGDFTDWEDDQHFLGNLSASRAVRYTTVAMASFAPRNTLAEYQSSVNSYLEILGEQAAQLRTLTVEGQARVAQLSQQGSFAGQMAWHGNRWDASLPSGPDFRHICKLTMLEQLKVYGFGLNMRGELPPCIGDLTNLKTLHFTYSNFTRYPASLSKLTQLRDFMVTTSDLRAGLPSNIGDLTSLQRLVFSGGGWGDQYALPRSLSRLTSLMPPLGNATCTRDPCQISGAAKTAKGGTAKGGTSKGGATAPKGGTTAPKDKKDGDAGGKAEDGDDACRSHKDRSSCSSDKANTCVFYDGHGCYSSNANDKGKT